MIKRKIVFTKETPTKSKKYIKEYLTKNKIKYSPLKNGILIRLDDKEYKETKDRIEGIKFYCRMKELK